MTPRPEVSPMVQDIAKRAQQAAEHLMAAGEALAEIPVSGGGGRAALRSSEEHLGVEAKISTNALGSAERHLSSEAELASPAWRSAEELAAEHGHPVLVRAVETAAHRSAESFVSAEKHLFAESGRSAEAFTSAEKHLAAEAARFTAEAEQPPSTTAEVEDPLSTTAEAEHPATAEPPPKSEEASA